MLSYCILIILFVSGVYLRTIIPTPVDIEKPLYSDPRDPWVQAARFLYFMLVLIFGILVYDAARWTEKLVMRCARGTRQRQGPKAATNADKAEQGDQAV